MSDDVQWGWQKDKAEIERLREDLKDSSAEIVQNYQEIEWLRNRIARLEASLKTCMDLTNNLTIYDTARKALSDE
jgi:chromosome segregation ATPase